MHRTGELYGQFKTLEQQKDTATLGMWIFLVTEVMFFGGIMMAYTLNRHVYFPAFAMGSNTLSLKLGGFNTVVLLASSFTMAMAVWSAQTSRKKLISLFLTLTIILGFVFFGVKYVEYSQNSTTISFQGRTLTFSTRRQSGQMRRHQCRGDEYGTRRTRTGSGRRSGPESARATLLFSLFRNDRFARAAHGDWRRIAFLALEEFVRRSLQRQVEYSGRHGRLVLAFCRYCLDLSVSAAVFD